MAYKIVRKKLSSIIPNDTNPRSIKDHKFQKLVANMQAFPKMLEIRPIVIDSTNKILGGNMRFQAAKFLGWTTVPTIDASNLTEQERSSFIILDNQDFGEWDFNILANTYQTEDLIKLGFDEFDLGMVEQTVRGGGEFDGLPEYEPKENPFQLMVQFASEAERETFIKRNKIEITSKAGLTQSCWWPSKGRTDNSSVKFQ